jgi:diadenosine tetraphosphatase ApaH/serine/threonine PP2A family protein phosphatase
VDYALTALISDLHANQPALATALLDARARGAERFVCLGDMIGYGASPLDALDWVMQLCCPEPRDSLRPGDLPPLRPGLCLRGNHEDALLMNSAEDFNPKARAAIEWTRDQLNTDESGRYWDFIGALEPTGTDEIAMFAHGSPRDPVREYILPRDIHDTEKMRENFALMERDVCFVGHSHVPAIYYQDGRLFRPRGTEGPYELGFGPENRAIVNVGSVGQPRDGDPRLSYVLFDGRTIEFVRLDYDHAQAASSIRAVKALPEYLADRLALGR